MKILNRTANLLNLKKKSIILSSILFSAITALVSCGSPSSKDETFYSVNACDGSVPSRFVEKSPNEIPVALNELEDGTYALYQSEFRVEKKVSGRPALFEIWEKVAKQQSSVAGAPSYNIQNGWGCVSAKDALAEKSSFVVETDVLRIFRKTNGSVEWINRRMGIHSSGGGVSRFYNDPVRVVGRETNGRERVEVEISKTGFNEFYRGIFRYWDEFSFVNTIARTYEFHGMKRMDADTVIYVRAVYEKQKELANDLNGDLFIPLPTVDVIH